MSIEKFEDPAIRKLNEYIKMSKERWITGSNGNNWNNLSANRKKLETKIGKKSNRMDTWSNELRKLHTRWPEHVLGGQILKEKLSYF